MPREIALSLDCFPAQRDCLLSALAARLRLAYPQMPSGLTWQQTARSLRREHRALDGLVDARQKRSIF